MGRETARSEKRARRGQRQERRGDMRQERGGEERRETRSGGEELGGAVWYRRGMPWLFDVAMPRYRPAGLGAARRGSARCATPWCCRLTYLSAVVPPATGSAASVQSGVLPICIPGSPPGRSPTTAQFTRSRSIAASPLLPPSSFSLLLSRSPFTFAHLVPRLI